jgi:transposase
MFTRIKKSGKYEYLQICESTREGKSVKQRVVATIGRIDRLRAKGTIEQLVRSLAKYSEEVLLVLTGESDPKAMVKKIGPSLIFERLWRETGIKRVIEDVINGRKHSFCLERTIFLTVLHRLFVSGSDRNCIRWQRDYKLEEMEGIQLHHLYRAMFWLGEELDDQKDATTFSPRCTKDLIEEKLFLQRRDLFSNLDLVFFDTTSIYFEGNGGEAIGARGHSKDHRPDLKQMVVGVILDDIGYPICCEMWPGNTADVKTLIPIMDRLRKRFSVNRICVVADRGMISKDTVESLSDKKRNIPYILGARMRKVKEIREIIEENYDLKTFKEVYPESQLSKAPAPLSVKDIKVGDHRYILCYNSREARKDAADREAIVMSLREKIERNTKSLIGNKGYRKYLKIERETVKLNENKIETEAKFDGMWVLQTNMDWSSNQIALKYKELWQVEHLFRDLKSILHTRPIYHKCDETIRGHVFCSFLALILRKELQRRLEDKGYHFEWSNIKQDLKALQETAIHDNGRSLAIRSECQGVCGKLFQAVGIAVPPTIREI